MLSLHTAVEGGVECTFLDLDEKSRHKGHSPASSSLSILRVCFCCFEDASDHGMCFVAVL